MKQGSSPLTKSEFENWRKKIARNNDTVCDYCKGKLETKKNIPFLLA